MRVSASAVRKKQDTSNLVTPSIFDGLVGTQKLDRVLNRIKLQDQGWIPSDSTVGNFLLCGPTGCGKTYLSEVLALNIHRSSSRLLRINCGEYQNHHEVARLTGAPPGYLGHRETKPVLGAQAMAALKSEYSSIQIVVFDEIEKAHPDFQHTLLGIFDRANLSTGDGEKVPFNNTIFFMTSNLGVKSQNSMGFGGKPYTKEELYNRSIKKFFTPEFCNRLHDIIIFDSLTSEELKVILRKELVKIQRLIGASEIRMTPEVENWFIAHGFSKEYGARPLKRLLEENILVPCIGNFNHTKNVIQISMREDTEEFEFEFRHPSEDVDL